MVCVGKEEMHKGAQLKYMNIGRIANQGKMPKWLSFKISKSELLNTGGNLYFAHDNLSSLISCDIDMEIVDPHNAVELKKTIFQVT